MVKCRNFSVTTAQNWCNLLRSWRYRCIRVTTRDSWHAAATLVYRPIADYMATLSDVREPPVALAVMGCCCCWIVKLGPHRRLCAFHVVTCRDQWAVDRLVRDGRRRVRVGDADPCVMRLTAAQLQSSSSDDASVDDDNHVLRPGLYVESPLIARDWEHDRKTDIQTWMNVFRRV